MKTAEKLEQVVYDLYYSMKVEYDRAIALESVAQLLFSLHQRKVMTIEIANRLWMELNGGDQPLLTIWRAR